MSGIGMTVNYKSGTTIGQSGRIEQERRRRSGAPEYFVRWADGTSGWFLAQNLHF